MRLLKTSPSWLWLAACMLMAGLSLWNAQWKTQPSRAAVAYEQAVNAAQPAPQLALQNIEEIEPGQIVIAWDEETGQITQSPVVQTFQRAADQLCLLDIRSANGAVQQIETTAEHPFWVEGQGFVEAEQLQSGDRLVHADGAAAEVLSLRFHAPSEKVPVFNFEVAGQHTYFVAGKAPASRPRVGTDPRLVAPFDPVLVHNACTRREATRLAKERAGIPRSQQPKRSWTIHDPKKLKGSGTRHPSRDHQGVIHEFQVKGPGGKTEYKYVVVHPKDPNHGGIGHVHNATSKAGPTSRLNPGDSYLNVDELMGGGPIPFNR